MPTKNEIRKIIKERVRALTREERAEEESLLFDRLREMDEVCTARTILLFHALPDEVCTHAFVRELACLKQVLLPVCVGETLELRRYKGEGCLQAGSFHIAEPTGAPFTDFAQIDALIIPGVAFTQRGERLGRGKGYYDRLLAHPALADKPRIGIGYDCQIVEDIPCEAHDVRMTHVVTAHTPPIEVTTPPSPPGEGGKGGRGLGGKRLQLCVQFYISSMRSLWNTTAARARQATFLFDRGFMDYHADRFRDRSLLFRDAHGKVVALLPACEKPGTPDVIQSHGGLTYGGLLTLPEVTTAMMSEIFDAMLRHYRSEGVRSIEYKPLPHIYQRYPSDEDLYLLFRHNARLTARAIASVIRLDAPYPLSTLRRRKAQKAEKTDSLYISETNDRLPEYWALLDQVLMQHHDTHPVHTLAELQLLAARFPEQIRLVSACRKGDDALLAGTLLFVTPKVVHLQYIAVGDEGRACCALDFLFAELLQRVQRDYPEADYFDFGTCTEDSGRVLNEGLIFQKEGFGARGVCYDCYTLDL